MSVDLPDLFRDDLETVKPLARAKRRVAKDFKWTRLYSLEDAMLLAYWLYIFERYEEAMEVCQFLGQAQFTGDTRIWANIEGSLALQARLLRSQGQQAEAKVCVERIRTVMEQTYSPGGPAERLNGGTLQVYERNAADTQREMHKPSERSWRLQVVVEACTLIELGGSVALPVDMLEEHVKEHMARLKVLA